MKRVGILLVLLIAGQFAPLRAWADQPGDHDWPRMMWGGGWFFGPVMMIILIAAIVFVVVLVVRWLAGPSQSATAAPSGKTATDILKERVARGEIDGEEFEERRRLLRD